MSTNTGAPVVVGIDCSPHQQVVIDWAVSEARLRRRPLHLVHVFDWALLGFSYSAAPYGAVQESLHRDAEECLRQAEEAARDTAPDLDIRGRVADGGPSAVLRDLSATAAVVVIGHRGRGGFAGLLTGSVATQVAAHAECPVVVVRPPVVATRDVTRDGGRVVVGVDGSPLSGAALGFGFEEAALRGIGLTAVHAWTGPVSTAPGDMIPLVYDTDDVREEETRLLAESLAGWRERYPDVDVERVVVRGRPAHALVDAAAGATLLVVGSRGRGGFTGLLLGSVSHAVLQHATTTLAVVHGAVPR